MGFEQKARRSAFSERMGAVPIERRGWCGKWVGQGSMLIPQRPPFPGCGLGKCGDAGKARLRHQLPSGCAIARD